MALSTQISIAEICAGVQGLGLALKIVLGERARPCLFVEREAYSAAVNVARMADAAMGEAAIYSDVTTFDGRPWRGKIHIVAAGFPCQPFSVAGKQQHTRDDRWIWPDIARTLREMGAGGPDGPELVLLENVTGLTLSPDVAGEEGWRLPAGLWHVLGDLAAMGFAAEWGCVRASDVGAPHRRYRLFILAHAGCRRIDSPQQKPKRGSVGSSTSGSHGSTSVPGSGKPRCRRAKEPANQIDRGSRESGAAVADTSSRQFQELEREPEGRSRSGSASEILADPSVERTRSVSDRQGRIKTDHTGRASVTMEDSNCGGQPSNRSKETNGKQRRVGYPEFTDDELDLAHSAGRSRNGRTAAFQGGNGTHHGLSIASGDSMAFAAGPGQQERRCVDGNNGEERAAAERDCLPLFPPGPGLGGYGVIDSIVQLYERDPEAAWERYQAELRNTLRWRDILDVRPDLAPSIEVATPAESKLQRMVDGSTESVDQRTRSVRVDRLRAVGEGVVPLAAATAFVILLERLGVDLQE